MKITYFVHGTTTDNEENICTGWNQGELSELGIQQSKELPALHGRMYDVVYCSDLKRAVDSTQLAFPNATIVQDKRLRECNYGDLNGAEENLLRKLEHIEVPFPNGESYKDVEVRIRSFLQDHQEENVVIVAHQAPQLALEVITNGKTWEQAFASDWRNTKSWQPGWEYVTK